MKATSPSLKFVHPAVLAALAVAITCGISVRPAQAGYTVTLQQVGPNVVATGSGAIDLRGLTFSNSNFLVPEMVPSFRLNLGPGVVVGGCRISTGPFSSMFQDPRQSVDNYSGGLNGPTSFGPRPFGLFGPPKFESFASSGSGDMVGIDATSSSQFQGVTLSVPRGYVSGTALSDSATYNFKTIATLRVTPGTYVWTWGIGANQSFTLQILPGRGPNIYVLYNAATRQTAIWYLNNNAFVGGAYGPTLPSGWGLRGAADFNGDIDPDYGLFNSVTHQTALWYLSGPTYIGGASGPTLPSSWELLATADFNGDNKSDYVLYNASTHQTAVWYLDNNVFLGGAFGPTLPVGWGVVGVADFNGDGHPDYALFNSATRQTVIWYSSGPTLIGGAYGPTLPNGWTLLATPDFNGDGHPDFVLENADTRQTVIWYLNNNAIVSGAYGPTLPTGWSLVATLSGH